MMKEEKGNIEQMSERLFHYLRKRESSASQEAEDEVWSKISEQIDKKKHIPVYRWLIPVTAVAAASLLFVFWLNNQAYDTIHSADVQGMSISPEMEQAATIDGCTRIQALIRILLPVAAPGIVTTLIFIFINAWNEYTVALTLISTDTSKPLTVGINIFNGYNMIEWQYLFAASLFAILPVVILFMGIEKNLTSGLTAGGVKG